MRKRLDEAARRGDEVSHRELEETKAHLARELAAAEAGGRDAAVAMASK